VRQLVRVDDRADTCDLSAGSHSATGGGILVDDVLDTATAALDRGDCRLRRVGDVDAGVRRDLSDLKEAVGIRTRV
jgi:hypothetical protein